jgi:hypothetical protein
MEIIFVWLVEVFEKGKNYGWNIMEGSLPYAGGDQEELELPVWEYGRDEGIAVIGGFVYRGPTATALSGAYIYGDYGTGRIWALTLSENRAPTNNLLYDTSLNILSFGVDNDLELYICGSDGRIYMFGLGSRLRLFPRHPLLLPHQNLPRRPQPRPRFSHQQVLHLRQRLFPRTIPPLRLHLRKDPPCCLSGLKLQSLRQP